MNVEGRFEVVYSVLQNRYRCVWDFISLFAIFATYVFTVQPFGTTSAKVPRFVVRDVKDWCLSSFGISTVFLFFLEEVFKNVSSVEKVVFAIFKYCLECMWVKTRTVLC